MSHLVSRGAIKERARRGMAMTDAKLLLAGDTRRDDRRWIGSQGPPSSNNGYPMRASTCRGPQRASRKSWQTNLDWARSSLRDAWAFAVAGNEQREKGSARAAVRGGTWDPD